MKIINFFNTLKYWYNNDSELSNTFLKTDDTLIDDSNDTTKHKNKEKLNVLLALHPETKTEKIIIKTYKKLYSVLSVIICCFLIFVLLLTVSHLPKFGELDVPTNNEVADRYINDGLNETGAINIVAGMILDYRAFDTLGESHVLFTAVCCVFILLKTTKNKSNYEIEVLAEKNEDKIYKSENDIILRTIVFIIFPVLLIFGIYIMLNGHLGPGGGFSGGAVTGAGIILYSYAFGHKKVQRFFNERTFKTVSCMALCFYSLSKTYSFFTGANHIESIISKGVAGAILSSGLILPLNIAVGFVVACTMYGFFTVFKRGEF